MKIGGDTLMAAMAASMKSKTNPAAKMSAGAPALLEQALRDWSDSLKKDDGGIGASQEAVDLSRIWQGARDTALKPLYDMTIDARNTAMRSANEATVNDSQRRIMDMEIKSSQAEMTRIGLTNNVGGHLTLSETSLVETQTKSIEEVDKPVYSDPVTGTKPQLDAVWVMDYSGSMGTYFNSLVAAAPKMFQALQDKGYDVKMGVVGFESAPNQIPTGKLQDNAAAFQRDVSSVVISGGIENGQIALQGAVDIFKGEFRPDATKVTILITDEPSNEFMNRGSWGGANDDALSTNAGADAMRQKSADALKSVGSELYAVGRGYTTDMPDKDYQDVVAKVGKGANISLDWSGDWVNKVTDNFVASVQKDIESKQIGTEKGYVEKTVSTYDYKVKNEWDLNFQSGARTADGINGHFLTVISDTSGFSKMEAGTAEKARNSLTEADNTINFLNNVSIQASTMKNNFGGIAADLSTKSMNPAMGAAIASASSSYKNNELLGMIASSLKARQ